MWSQQCLLLWYNIIISIQELRLLPLIKRMCSSKKKVKVSSKKR